MYRAGETKLYYYAGRMYFSLIILLIKFSDIGVGRKVEINRKQIKVTTDGPYIVSGDIPLFDMTIQCDIKVHLLNG